MVHQRNRNIFWAAPVFVIMVFAAACQRTPPKLPPEPKLGVHTCAACSMPLSDAKTVGAFFIDEAGKTDYLLYDDLGCMLDAERDKPAFQIRERWVVDFTNTGWIHAVQAVYISSPSIRTPMSSGIIAFSSAEAAARQGGPEPKTFTYSEIQAERKASMEARFGKPPG